MSGPCSVAGIVLKGDQVFVGKRLPVGEMGDRWEFPGGKVDAGETREQALVREYKEEFGIDVKVGRHITDTHFTHGNKDVLLSAYEVFFPETYGPFVFTEHSDAAFVPLSSIPELYFVESDKLIYDDVVRFARENNQ